MLSDSKHPRRLDLGQVDVWLTPLSVITDDLQRAYERLLNASEHARWQRFAVPNPQLQYLVARTLLRTTLSQYAGAPTGVWQFDTNPHGRPFISGPADFRALQFNLSHTEGLVACAVARECEVGVDVENVGREIDIAELAPSVFAPMELASLAQRPPGERRDLFFSYWTLKEAYIKARGMGLSLALDGFWFDLTAASPRAYFTERCPDDSDRWRFRQYAPTRQHKLAVAVATPANELDIRVRWAVPLMSALDARKLIACAATADCLPMAPAAKVPETSREAVRAK
jgi:4'-phosphopantetheinyl transferase